MTKPKDSGESLSAVMNALAEHAAYATDEELLADAAAQGTDTKAEGARIRVLLRDAVLRAKQTRLRGAEEAHRRVVAEIAARAIRLPTDPGARRALLNRSLQRRPEMREAVVTLQHRDFDSMSDADVESALKQLDALGLLDEEPDPKP